MDLDGLFGARGSALEKIAKGGQPRRFGYGFSHVDTRRLRRAYMEPNSRQPTEVISAEKFPLKSTWWPGAESNHQHADFQSAYTLSTPLKISRLRRLLLRIPAYPGHTLGTSNLAWAQGRQVAANVPRPRHPL